MNTPLSEWSDALAARVPALGPFAVYAQTGSTQDVCRARVEALGTRAAGFVCVAESQIAGRGRLGRTWVAPAGRVLTFSMCAPADLSPGVLALAVPVALARAMDDLGAPTTIKWPNDLYAEGRKLAGVLIEVVDETPIIGIGLNTQAEPADFPEELRSKATSLAQLGIPCDPLDVLSACLAEWTLAIAEARENQTALRLQWKARCTAFGRNQTWIHEGTRIAGEAVDVDPEAGLLVRTCEGTLLRLPAATTASE